MFKRSSQNVFYKYQTLASLQLRQRSCLAFSPSSTLKLKQLRPAAWNCICKRNLAHEPDHKKDTGYIPYPKDPYDVLKRPITMDELYKPEGSFQEAYAIQNKRFNRNLIIATLALAGTILVFYKADCIDPVAPPPMKNPKPVQKTLKEAKMVAKQPLTKTTLVKGLPEKVPFLIVGAGTASFAAFRAIRQSDPKAKVLVIGNEDYYPYMRPPLSKELWFTDPDYAKDLKFRQWSGKERNVFFEHDEFYVPVDQIASKETGGVAVVRGHSVTRVDPVEKKVYLDNDQVVEYGKCLLAPGGEPKNLPVFQNASKAVQDRILLYRRVEDFHRLDQTVKDSSTKSVAIVGGGFLGSELACALARRKLLVNPHMEVVQLFPESGNIANVLPEYLSQWTTRKIQEEGVKIIPQAQVTGADMEGNQVTLTLNNGESVRADLVVVAVGLQPNVELAKASGLEIDPVTGGYSVNAELEARSNLFVAGDAACFYDINLGRRRVEHHDHAVVSGRLAGENMAGAHKPYWHQSMFWSDLGPKVGFEAIGICDSSLPTVAVFAKSTEQDTPQAATQQTSEGSRGQVETSIPADSSKPRAPQESDDYGKGLVFYLRDNVIVGILLWNVFNRMPIARLILKEGKQYSDLNEVAKLFRLHVSHEDEEKEIEEKIAQIVK